MGAHVSLVLVSHSEKLAEGSRELAAQMAPGVDIEVAGGLEDGSIGTSFDRISGAIEDAAGFAESDSERELKDVVVICDLGSAILSTEAVLEFLPSELEGHVYMADAPFVEGAIAAAVEAASGSDAETVLNAANATANTFTASHPPAHGTEATQTIDADGAITKTLKIKNALGLHARPAAVLARLVAGFDAQVTLNGVNGASVIEIMKLGLTGGQEVVVTASGEQASAAVTAVSDAINGGFGEL